MPLAPPFLPPVSIVPLKTPTAKKAKYMIAAGIFCILDKIGGSDRLTVCRLFMPMMTRSSRTKTRNIVLSSSLMFISRLGLRLGCQEVKSKRIHCWIHCWCPVVSTEELVQGKAKLHKPTSLNAIRGALRQSFSSRNEMLATTLVMECNYWSFTLQGGSTSGWA